MVAEKRKRLTPAGGKPVTEGGLPNAPQIRKKAKKKIRTSGSANPPLRFFSSTRFCSEKTPRPFPLLEKTASLAAAIIRSSFSRPGRARERVRKKSKRGGKRKLIANGRVRTSP